MISLFVDGGVNPGKGIYFSVLYDMYGERHRIYEREERTDYSTNNEAEYLGVIAALTVINALDVRHAQKVLVHSDSQLIVRQLCGLYRVKKEHLKPLHATVKVLETSLATKGFPVLFKWVPREQIVPILGH